MFRWNDMYIYNTRIVGETNSKQTLKRRRAHDGSFESQSRQDWSTDRGVCSTITNRIKRRTVRGYQPFGQCVYTYIYVYIRKTWARWQKTGSLRTYVYSVVQFRLRPTAMTSMGCHASLLLFCRILMEARLINELVVEGTRKDSRGGGISPPSFFLDSPRSVAIASGFFKGKSPVVGCLRFCPNCFFFFFFDKLQASFLR